MQVVFVILSPSRRRSLAIQVVVGLVISMPLLTLLVCEYARVAIARWQWKHWCSRKLHGNDNNSNSRPIVWLFLFCFSPDRVFFCFLVFQSSMMSHSVPIVTGTKKTQVEVEEEVEEKCRNEWKRKVFSLVSFSFLWITTTAVKQLVCFALRNCLIKSFEKEKNFFVAFLLLASTNKTPHYGIKVQPGFPCINNNLKTKSVSLLRVTVVQLKLCFRPAIRLSSHCKGTFAQSSFDHFKRFIRHKMHDWAQQNSERIENEIFARRSHVFHLNKWNLSTAQRIRSA